MKVLFLASEVAPFAKTGGLADVCGSLPKALRRLGLDVRVAMPYYRLVKEGPFQVEMACKDVETLGGGIPLRGDIYVASLEEELPLYLVNKDEFFDRNGLYGTPRGDYFDNLERFVFFCKTALLLCEKLNFSPDIVHCHDWQTGLIPAYLRTLYRRHPLFGRTASIFTVHNLAYQGVFPGERFEVTGLPPDLFTPEGLEFWGKINLLKSGIVFSDEINTVSRKYSREIQTPEFGCGLDGVLRSRKEDLSGILNGVDYREWNPKTDRLIAANFDAIHLAGKARCKEDLLRAFDLPSDLEAQPIIGMISRLVDQKGLDLLVEIVDELMKKNLGLVILGTGDPDYERGFLQIAERYPEKMGVRIAYDNTLAHKIEAGADMFLMPSRYEPCGLNQIFSLKYGTVPIVRATGGLDDTIVDYNPRNGKGTGFKFKRYRAGELLEKIEEALFVFQDRRRWEKLMVRGMTADFSWEKSAREYVQLYLRGLAKIGGGRK